MAEKKYLPPKNLVNPFIKNLDEYDEMYQESISDPQTFFGDQAEKNLSWVEPFSSVHNGEFVDSKWFENGKIKEVQQAHSKATLAPKITSLDQEINWDLPSEEIERKKSVYDGLVVMSLCHIFGQGLYD